jgi:AcrR family transcriptional regulator
MDHKDSSTEKRSRDARVVRSRAGLRSALLALLAQHEVSAVTVQMIVAEAGIGYATFFRHYPSVDALLIDVADSMIAEFIAQAMSALLKRDRAAILAALSDYVRARRGAVTALLVGGGDAVRREITARAIEQTRALPLGFDEVLPRELAVTHAVSSAITVIRWWVSQDAEINVGALIDRLALQPLSQ